MAEEGFQEEPQPAQEPEKVYSIDDALAEIKKTLIVFSLNPMQVAPLTTKFDDAAGEEIVLTVTAYRLKNVPKIEIASAYGDKEKTAAVDYSLFVNDRPAFVKQKMQECSAARAAAEAKADEEVDSQPAASHIRRIG